MEAKSNIRHMTADETGDDDQINEALSGSQADSLESLLISPQTVLAENPGISVISAALLITNAALGAGLLNFPLAFHESGGLVPGNFVHLFFVLATAGSLYILAMTADRFKSRTYQEMVSDQCGVWAGHFASACIALYCLITCITFIIIVGDQTDRFFADFVGPNFCESWWLQRRFTMSLAGVAVLALSLFRDMAKLVSMGYLGSVFMVYLVVVVVVVWRIGGYQPGEVVVFDKHKMLHLFNVLPTICFGYQCHVSSVPIYHSIRDRSKSKYFMACTLAMAACALVYSLAANVGYLTFGSTVADDLLLSYDNDHRGAVAVSVAVIALALKSIATYPVLMFCVREAVVSFYVSARDLSPADAQRTEPVRRYVVVVLLWLVSLGAALLAESIASVVKLLGSLASFFIFILPGLCLLAESNRMSDERTASGPTPHILQGVRHASSWGTTQVLFARIVALTFISLGVFTFGLSVTMAGMSAFSSSSSSAPLCVVGDNSSYSSIDVLERYRFSWLPSYPY
ncbi:putative sodium-coupled neutral amino acid transporter 7 [Hyalella azteca]|uniref:Sodium-coupled neutral amino acid transporter 7 n=1 Tax=Hyalella azteca TaxID=294128 RepID=A0A8B7NEG7_HYAAZ|nr:putative sodium-coupled neutral amino acid transporter 7 [Hyalella azteca]